MLLRSAAAKTLRSILTLCGTLGIVATSIATLQFGYLTLTVDLVLKLFVTYAYAHGLTNIDSIIFLRKPKVSIQNDGSTVPFISMQEMKDVGRFEKEKIVSGGMEVTHGQCQRETGTSKIRQPQCIATIVGWREDEDLYRRCLQGFAGNPHCAAVVAGIDGNTSDDEEMVKVFLNVFPDGVVIRLQEQLSRTLDQYMVSTNMTNSDDDENTRNMVMEHLCNFVRGILREELFPQSAKDVRAICVVQPHYSKKDILLTALTFASAISAELDVQYLFSTDSDSIIMPDALGKITTLLESDSKIGGVSGHLRFFHPRPTFLSRMTTSHYWFEQEIAKIQGAIFGATECQPGPCAAFRISALKSVLVPWYCQKIFGHRTITNEDRHLTTRILLAGFTVHYAPDAVIYTETPNNLDGWVKQQVRWSRGTMIETLWYPRMINRLYPWHIYNILKARSVPLLTFWFTTSYALGFGGNKVSKISNTMVLIDIFCMIALQVTYIVHLGPDSTSPSDIIWLLPSIIWFFLMSPGIVVWSLITILDDSWGNLPRAIGWRNVAPSEGKGKGKEHADESQFTSIARKSSLELKYVGFQILWLIIIMVAIFRALDLF